MSAYEMFYTGSQMSAPARFGQDVAGAMAPDDLFLELFGGEVLTHYYASTIMRDKHYRRVVKGQKSAKFPRLYRLGAEYHVPGTEMLGQKTYQTQKEITLDALLTSHFALYDLDEAMTHFDVRAPYAEAAGQALAEVYDKNVMRAIVLGARESMTDPFPSGKQLATADVTGLAGGFADASLSSVNPLGLIGAARAARLFLRGLNVPDSLPFYGVLKPEHMDMLKWARLASGTSSAFYGDLIFQHTDYTTPKQGMAGLAETITIEGITFMASNLIPFENETNDDEIWPKYRADYSGTLGLIWSPMAVGTLELLGMTMEMERTVRRKENFVVASMAVGHGTLRNELCIEITNG